MTKRLPQLADIHDCTGCMACVDSCAQKALNSYRGDDGHLYVRLNEDKCVGCLKCEKVCKGRDLYQGNNDLKESSPFAAWTSDSVLRSRSTSGGVFAAVAKKILQDGGVVVGSSFDGRYAKHIVIEKYEDLKNLQGSKYVQSNTEGVFNEIKKYLPERKVLFSGVGCQVAAVLSYFANSSHKDNLFTMDLICGGVPSDLLMVKYFEMKKGLDAISSFRTKRKYELRGIIDGKENVLGRGALPLAGFAAELTNRFSCYDCQYAYAHRKCDITIGDLWGNVGFGEERENGLSLAIAHNERGLLLLKESDLNIHPIKWRDFLPYNGRLVIGKAPIPYLRKTLARNACKLTNATFAEVYSSTVGINQPVFFLDRCIRALQNRFLRHINNKKIREILSE